MACTEFVPNMQWEVQGHQFTDDFRILALENYDGIIGHDWLAKHSPMLTHWAQQWLALQKGSEFIVLHGARVTGNSSELLKPHLIQTTDDTPLQTVRPDIQLILD